MKNNNKFKSTTVCIIVLLLFLTIIFCDNSKFSRPIPPEPGQTIPSEQEKSKPRFARVEDDPLFAQHRAKEEILKSRSKLSEKEKEKIEKLNKVPHPNEDNPTEEEVCVDVKKKRKKPKYVRQSAIAGTWYTAIPDDLKNEFNSYLEVPKKKRKYNVKNIDYLVLPHAGFYFSGRTIASTLTVIKKKQFKNVFIIGPTHHDYFSGFSIDHKKTHYSTPLGEVKINDGIVEELKKNKNFQFKFNAHIREHSLEIQLPFLQHLFTDFEIVPVLIGGGTSNKQLKSIAKDIKKIFRKYNDSLLIISSDFTHFGPNYNFVPFNEKKKENLEKLDMRSFDLIKKFQIDQFLDEKEESTKTVCGKKPIGVLMYMLEDEKDEYNVILEHYSTSGEISNDFTNSVSYLGIIYEKKKKKLKKEEPKIEDLAVDMYTNEEKSFILKTIRKTVKNYLKTKKIEKIDLPDNEHTIEKFNKIQGCFVTYHKDHNLRGCIGHIYPHTKLYDCIIQNSISAAVNDHRFNPMTYDEFVKGNIDIEVSILTKPQKLKFSSPEDLLKKLRKDIDGVILSKGSKQSTYLPSVWEQLPEKKTFLSQLCRKAGLKSSCWKDKDINVQIYRTIMFQE